MAHNPPPPISVWNRNPATHTKKVKKHLIEAVRFRHGKPSEAAPIRCACGWRGKVAGWREHWTDNNERPYSTLRLRTPPEQDYRPQNERDSSARGAEASARQNRERARRRANGL